jgi:hypothetical protein
MKMKKWASMAYVNGLLFVHRCVTSSKVEAEEKAKTKLKMYALMDVSIHHTMQEDVDPCIKLDPSKILEVEKYFEENPGDGWAYQGAFRVDLSINAEKFSDRFSGPVMVNMTNSSDLMFLSNFYRDNDVSPLFDKIYWRSYSSGGKTISYAIFSECGNIAFIWDSWLNPIVFR